MHYFKRNIGDYHKKAGRLSMLEHGAYTLLIDSCYDRERFPTMDEAIDWCWARTDEEIAAVRFVLGKFFELVEGRYVQARIQEEIDAYHAKSMKNKEIAEEREAKRRMAREQSCTKRAQGVNEAPPNQEPITNNQEPIKETPPNPRKRGQSFDASAIDLPDWLDREDWAAWVADRKARKKPITEKAAELQIKQLADLRQQGHAPADVIAHSIASSYLGLFAPGTPNRTAQAGKAQRLADWNDELRNVLAESGRPAEIFMGTIDATH
ncbi:YdaU family protein [Bordetella trematum]|uniref:YdaU family protein n=1 Tax=Bordetella trematum TaxID=123899 RepID=UPI0039891968